MYYAQTSTSGIGPWQKTTSLPSALDTMACFVSGDYVYCLGGGDDGLNGGLTSSMVSYYAQLSSSGGIIGGWQQTTSIPYAINSQSCAAYSGYAYCVFTNTVPVADQCGCHEYTPVGTDVYYAQISSSGGLGAWQQGPPLAVSSQIKEESCLVVQAHFYCIGGIGGPAGPGGSISSTVSGIGLEGSGGFSGGWSISSSGYPTPIAYESCFPFQSLIYCVDGDNGVGLSGSVYFAPVSRAGDVGAWTSAANYSNQLRELSCASAASDLYCIGGEDTNDNPYSNTSYAAIDIILDDQESCAAIGGVWNASASTCTLGSSLELETTLEVASGTTLQITSGGGLSIYDSMSVDSGGAVTNAGTLQNDGFIDDVGTITNSGTATNLPGATLQITGLVTNTGTMDNLGAIDVTFINGHQGLLANSGTITNSGSIVGFAHSIENFCPASITGNPPPSDAVREVPCAPTITTASGIVSIAGGVTISGTDDLAGASSFNIYVAPLGNDAIAETTTGSGGSWSVFVPLSQGTYTLYAVAETCTGPSGCFGSEFGSPGSNSVVVNEDNNLDQTTCETILAGAWTTSPDTCDLMGSFDVPPGASLNIGGGTTLSLTSGSSIFSNSGVLGISGTVLDGGTLANLAGGTVNDDGTITLTGSGTVTNAGTFNVTFDSATCQSYPLFGSWTDNYPFLTCTISAGTADTIEAGFDLSLSNAQVLVDSGSIVNDGTIMLSSVAFFQQTCGGALTGNPLSGNGIIQFVPCAPTITTPPGAYLTNGLAVSGTADLASNGGNPLTITLYSADGEIGSTTTDSGGGWTITGTPSPGVLTLYATATGSAEEASPPSADVTVSYQLLDQASCQSPIGGTWSTSACSLGGTFVLPGTGVLYIPSGTTLSVLRGGSFTCDGVVDNEGTLNNDGSLTNSYVVAGSQLLEGQFTSDGAITNTMNFLNDGRLTIDSGGVLTNDAIFTDGRLGGNSAGGYLQINSGGSFTNSQGATTEDQTLSFVVNGGSLTNAGTFTNDELMNFESSGSFMNSGTFTVNSANFESSGTFTNTGTFTIAFTQDSVPNFSIDGGTFANSGSLSLLGLGKGDLQAGTATNNAAGTMKNQFFLHIQDDLVNDGAIVNSLSPVAVSNDSPQFSGRFEIVGTLDNYGSFSNANSTAALLVASGGLVNNYGSVSNAGVVGPFSAGSAGTFAQTCSSTFTGNTVEGLTLATITGVRCTATVATQVEDAKTGSAWSGAEDAGAVAYDTATVTGVPVSVPTGTVTYSFFAGSMCSGTVSATGTVSLAAGAVPVSSPTGPLGAGSYSFEADYSGDSNYLPSASGCEAFAVLKASPTLFTTLSNGGTIVLGSPTTDTSTFVGGFIPEGMVGFTAFSGPGCTTSVFTSEDPVANGVATSDPFNPASVGAYYWTASYVGDTNNEGFTIPCSAAEMLVVTQAPTTMSTVVRDVANNAPWSGSEVAGAGAYDSSAVTGVVGIAPTGSVTYAFFTAGVCGGTPESSQTVVLSGGLAPDSSSMVLGAGSYAYSAAYSGDSNYKPSASPCEPFTLVKAPTSPSVVCTPAPATIGSATMCEVTVSGYLPSGSVTISSTSAGGKFSPNDGECTLAAGQCSVAYTDTTAGDPTITVNYSGDSNNLPSSGAMTIAENYKNCGNALSRPNANLEYCNLSGTDLSGANLEAANLQDTNLQGANLKGANLKGADLSYSDAAGTEFQGANLMGANLTSADGSNADFQGANLMGDSLKAGDFASADFQGANMKGDDLSSGIFTSVSFQGANLMNANMSYGDFDYANFTRANLHGVVITGATFVGAIDPPIPTTTTVSCSSSAATRPAPPAPPNAFSIECTATVNGGTGPNSPTGPVTWTTTSSTGKFTPPNCNMGPGPATSCSVQYTDTVAGTSTVTATYGGDRVDSVSSGTASVTFAQEATTTAVSCSPSPAPPGPPPPPAPSGQFTITCTATVTGGAGETPTGQVSWTTSSATGSFQPGSCNLGPADSCSVQYSETATGTSTVTASYAGDFRNTPSKGTVSVTFAPAASTTSLNCGPPNQPMGHTVTCSVTVKGVGPTGTVSFASSSGGTFSATSCTLGSSQTPPGPPSTADTAQCQVRFSAASTGSVTITATYSGDSNNIASSDSATVNFT